MTIRPVGLPEVAALVALVDGGCRDARAAWPAVLDGQRTDAAMLARLLGHAEDDVAALWRAQEGDDGSRVPGSLIASDEKAGSPGRRSGTLTNGDDGFGGPIRNDPVLTATAKQSGARQAIAAS